MTAADLIRFFETFTSLHIQIKDVLAEVRRGSPHQSIEFYENNDEKADVLRGFLVQEWVKRGWDIEEHLVSYIVYNGNMDINWKRLVACKELIHILDPEYAVTKTREDLQSLVDRMAVPMDLQGINGQELGDRVAEFQALAVLFPRAARNALMPKYIDKSLAASEIAKLAGIPERYIAYLMSERWVEMYDQLLDDPD